MEGPETLPDVIYDEVMRCGRQKAKGIGTPEAANMQKKQQNVLKQRKPLHPHILQNTKRGHIL